MTHNDAARLVTDLLEELDEDVYLGSMLYSMTDTQKRRLKQRLISKAEAIELTPETT